MKFTFIAMIFAGLCALIGISIKNPFFLDLAGVGAVVFLGSFIYSLFDKPYIMKKPEKLDEATQEKIAQQVKTPARKSKVSRDQKQLTALKEKFSYNDTELQVVFAKLLNLTGIFKANIIDKKCSRFITDEAIDKAELLFNSIVDTLELCYNTHLQMLTTTGETKKQLKANRTEMLKDIEDNIANFSVHIDELVGLSQKPIVDTMNQLSEELNFELEVARRTEEEFRKLEIHSDRKLTHEK